MKVLLRFLLLVPLILSGQAQKKDSITPVDTLRLKADLAITGFYQGGNVQTLIFRAKSDIRYRPWDDLQFQTKNSYVYQEFGKVKADEDILSLNFLHLYPKKKVSPLALAFLSTNFRREINLRYLLGAGAAIKVLQKKRNKLEFSVTFEYESTDFKSDDFNRDEFDGDSRLNTLRGTLWVSGRHELFKKKVILSHENYFQPSLEQQGNFRYRADFGLELPVWKFLSFKVNYLRARESVVIEGQVPQDEFLTLGFTVKNY